MDIKACLDTSSNARPESLYPEFIRLPKKGKWTGLSRSKLNQLILPCSQSEFKPPVKSVCLRQRGATKGTRLIVLDSLFNYLYSQIEEECTQQELPLNYDSADTSESCPKE